MNNIADKHPHQSKHQSNNDTKSIGSLTKNHNLEIQFEKNYPKNVFIPLIQYLAEKGYQKAYEQCVGTRQEIQRKNVVSLDMIFNLTREPWFQRNINKNLLLKNISNKILMNSKIKKKLFHLLIAQYILLEDHSSDIKQFKKNISRTANNISSQNLPSDQLFLHPNSIIYLLNLFLKIFKHSLESKGIQKIDEQFDQLKLQQAVPQGSKNKIIGSKQEYKNLVKQIVQLFCKRNVSIAQLADAFEFIKNTIIFRSNQIREQYKLIQKIPNWEDFISIVVTRCFQTRRKDAKITNMLFNEWINEYKSKTISAQTVSHLQTYQISEPSVIEKKELSSMSFKKFSPIILTQNYNS